MNITGQWAGTIIYGKEYRTHFNKELYFDMDINQENEKISGTTTDTGGFGMSPDKATIIGKMTNNKINFIKQYSSMHSYGSDGKTIVDKSKRGPEINYSGVYNEGENSFIGDWKMTVKVKIFWLIPLKMSASGTWMMKRK